MAQANVKMSREQADQATADILRASSLARELTGTAPGGRSKPWLERQLARQNVN
jgi:hypothetical protein